MALTGNSIVFQVEIDFMEWLQSHISDGAMRVISELSMFGEAAIVVLILGLIYWCINKKMGKTIGLNIIMALICNTMIKNVFLRRRPYFESDYIDIKRPVEPDADIQDIAAQGYSFPSGHSTTSAVTYGSLAAYDYDDPELGLTPDRRTLLKRLWSCAAVILPLLVGFSRVAVGAHFPTDVLVGWLLGYLMIWFVPFLRQKLGSKYLFYAVLLLIAAPGLLYCRSADYFTSFGILIGFIAGTEIEERYVDFKPARGPVWIVCRMIGGVAVVFLLDVFLKLPFSREFLKGGSYAAMLVRCARYFVVGIVSFGIYPMLFRIEEKFAPPQTEQSTNEKQN